MSLTFPGFHYKGNPVGCQFNRIALDRVLAKGDSTAETTAN